LGDETKTDRRQSERHDIDAEIEFIVDTDVIRAGAVDISDKGIALDLSDGLPILLQIRLDGEYFRRRGTLVRVSRKADKYRVAVEFDDGQTDGK
jgi:hypothetical protein